MERIVVDLPGNLTPEAAFYAGGEALLDYLGLALAKAATPHHSQFQHRGPGGAFGKAPDYDLWPLLPPDERAEAAARAHALVEEQLRPRLQTHLADWDAKKLTPEAWYQRSAADLRLFYGELYRLGKRAAGNISLLLTSQDKAVLNRILEDELHYLAGFRDHLGSGGGKMPYAQRVDLYANASWEAYWTGWVLGDPRPGRLIRWRLGKTEIHCGDCTRFQDRGWLPVATFVKDILAKGFAPRSGLLECTGTRCLCFLQEARAAVGADLSASPEPDPETVVTTAPAYVPEAALAAAKLPTSGVDEATRTSVKSKDADRVSGPGVTLTEGELLAYGDGKHSHLPTSETEAWDQRTAAALAALFFLPLARREDAVRDAVNYLYLNSRELVAHQAQPEVTRKLVALRDRLLAWLRDRHHLSERQAEAVRDEAVALRAFQALPTGVRWLTTRWSPPHLADYEGLSARYQQAEEA